MVKSKKKLNNNENNNEELQNSSTLKRLIDLNIQKPKEVLAQERANYEQNINKLLEDKKEEKEREGLWYRLKSIGGNTAANVITSPLEALGLISTVASYPAAKSAAILSGNKDADVFLPMLEENPYSKAGSVLEEQIRNDVGINQIEDMDRLDQMINIGSMFVGPSASKSDKLIKAMLKPGLQITKGASKLTKATQLGTQIGIPTVMNEALRYNANQPGIFGNYSEQEELPDAEELILAARKNARKDNIYQATINNKEEEKSLKDTVKDYAKTGAKVAAPIAAVALARKSKTVQKAIQNYKNAKISNQNAIKFDETLSLGDKVMNTIDTKNIIDKALEKGYIDEKAANNLYRNTYQQTVNSFDTGTLYLNDKIFQTDYAPRNVVREVQALKITNPKEYQLFNQFMDTIRQIQGKVYEYNRLNKTSFGIEDLMQKPGIATSLKMPNSVKSVAESYNDMQKLYKKLIKSGKFNQVLQKISNINNNLLDIGLETEEFSEKFAQDLRRNRNFLDLNIYLPGIKEQQEVKGFNAFLQKIGDSFSNSSLFNNNKIFATNKRLDTKTLVHAAPWDETFETNYKNTMKRLLDNKQKRDLVASLENVRNNKIQKSIKDIKNIQQNSNQSTVLDDLRKIDEMSDKIIDEFDTITYLGEVDLDTNVINPNKNPLYKTLNLTDKEIGNIERSINNKIGDIESQQVLDALTNNQTKAKYIAIPRDNTIKLYKVNDWFGQIVQQNPQNASIVYNVLRGTTNAMKSFVTGKFNPLFSPITASYTLSDQALGLKSINKALDTNISTKDFLKNAKQSYNPALKYKQNASKIENIFKNIESGKESYTTGMAKINALEQELRNSDINQIKSTGASIQGRYPVDVYKQKDAQIVDGFIANSLKTLTNLENKIKSSKLINNAAVNNTMNGINFTRYALESLRDAPTLGLYKSLSKNFMKDGKIDSNKIMQISRLLDKYTASGTLTPSQNRIGKVVKGSNDIIPYFSDMLSENIARGRQIDMKSITNHLVNLIDKDVNLKKELASIGKGITGNDFVKAGTSLVAIPTVLASFWNHASQENENAYDALPDNYKNRGIVFVNAVNGKPIVIPLTQSLMWIVTALREGVSDPMLRLNENKYNSGETFGDRLSSVANVNWNVSMPPAIGAMFNVAGYRSPTINELASNIKNKQFALDNYKLYNLNYSDGSYYNKGILSPKQRAVTQTLFGNPGATVAEMVDVASITKNPLDTLNAGLGKYLTTANNIISPKASTWSKTSEILYKKKELFDRAVKKDLNPEQQNIMNTIKMYKNSRLNQIDTKIKELRREINEIRNTGKSSGLFGSNSIDELTIQLKIIQNYKLKEYEKLDKLLKQNYNMTYDEFMEGIK